MRALLLLLFSRKGYWVECFLEMEHMFGISGKSLNKNGMNK